MDPINAQRAWKLTSVVPNCIQISSEFGATSSGFHQSQESLCSSQRYYRGSILALFAASFSLLSACIPLSSARPDFDATQFGNELGNESVNQSSSESTNAGLSLRAALASQHMRRENEALNIPAQVRHNETGVTHTAPEANSFQSHAPQPNNTQTNVTQSVISPPTGAQSNSADRYTIDAVKLPLQVLLYSLAEKAGVELHLDAELTQSVTLRVSQRSLEHILAVLAGQSGIRWQLSQSALTIASREPYLHSYPVDYLNMSRTVSSRVGLATQVGSINLSVDESSAMAGFSNSSQSVIENQSSHQFWESLNTDLQMILQSSTQSSASSTVRVSATAAVMINRDTGMVTVRGSALQHQEVAVYLEQIQSIAQRQVLIEATVVEVALSDEYQAGIDWRALANGGTGINAAQVFHGQALPGEASVNKLPAPSALLSAIHKSNTLGRISATLRLLQGFGDVRILSRPQIIAINNQSAILKVVDNRVYFTMSVERQSREGEDDVTTSTQIHTVPVGLVMSVTPYVGANNNVILNVRPTISRILGFINDPNPELAAARVQNGVPEIQVREMESVLRVADGDIVMIGGLMQQQRHAQTNSVPFLSDLPGIGGLFRSSERQSRKTELLVFLQPTVLNPAKSALPADSTGEKSAAASFSGSPGAGQ